MLGRGPFVYSSKSAVNSNILIFILGLQQQNTALALENRRVKQDNDKLIDDKKTALERIKDYESKVKTLEDEKKIALEDKEKMMEKMNKALTRLEKVGQVRDWSVTEYMVPSRSEIPTEVANYIEKILEDKTKSEATVLKLQEEVKRLHHLAFNSEGREKLTAQIESLTDDKFTLERELATINDDFNNVNKYLDNVTEEHDKCKKLKKEQRKEIEDLKILRSKLENDLRHESKLQIKYDEARKEIDKSNEEIERLKRKIVELVKEIDLTHDHYEQKIAEMTSSTNTPFVSQKDSFETATEKSGLKSDNSKQIEETQSQGTYL